jgi:hypothetical protein
MPSCDSFDFLGDLMFTFFMWFSCFAMFIARCVLEIMRVHAWRSWFGSQYDACVGWIV